MNMTSTSHAADAIESTTANPLCTLFHSLTRSNDSATPAVLRLALAATIFPHGAQKLLGWFGGYGFTGTMGFLTGTMGIPWLLLVSGGGRWSIDRHITRA